MNKDLMEWTINYVKNKDLTFRKLLKYEEHLSKEYIDFTFKDKMVTHFIVEQLKEDFFEKIKDHEYKTAVCLNTDENFKFLIRNWKKLSEIKNLSFVFVNLKINDK